MMARMWKRRTTLVVATFASFSYVTGMACAGTTNLDSAFTLLQGKGLRAAVEAINAKTNPLLPPAILSNKLCENIKDAEEKRKVQKHRELGLALLQEITSAKTNAASVRFSTVDDMLTIQSWCFREKGYGNLVLAYAAQDTASRLLLRLLADPANDVKEIRSRVSICLRDVPSSDYWTCMLKQENDSVEISTDKEQNSGDYLKLAALIMELNNRKAKELGRNDGGSGGFGGDHEMCYQEYNPAQVGHLVLHTAIQNIALEACLVVREKGKAIPTEQEAFVSVLRQEASSILKKRDRIGGWLTARHVWIIWNEALLDR